jgi:hypothetical protein
MGIKRAPGTKAGGDGSSRGKRRSKQVPRRRCFDDLVVWKRRFWYLVGDQYAPVRTVHVSPDGWLPGTPIPAKEWGEVHWDTEVNGWMTAVRPGLKGTLPKPKALRPGGQR